MTAKVKLCNNLALGISMIGACEAMNLVRTYSEYSSVMYVLYTESHLFFLYFLLGCTHGFESRENGSRD